MADEIYKPTVYVETTIPSYLTAWPSKDLIRTAHQQITREWWKIATDQFDLLISEAVVEEIALGTSRRLPSVRPRFSIFRCLCG